ncbi:MULTISPECIES: MarC family protein [Methylobacteriaceae]|uniref:MarC family protein n=1 Tax=Methylobacteriaceae TaxID=119045 RepID=UPI00074F8366|nr:MULTISPECIES: MarC family protein [Methylobacteriaceae]AMB45621.1 membrane protein [Methylobacterium sp. AMS5]TFZ61061.1 MarC family protein [Methylorubrum sp. Q1]
MLPSFGFETVLTSFLLALSSLFSIVNPVGSALMFAQITSERSHAERSELARRIGFYAALVILAALWAGAPILNFFGVSLAALRIAGGLFVAAFAWTMLTAPEAREARKHAEAEPETGENLAEVAFFPLTLPFTTGPGTIAVAIALGANRPSEPGELAGFFLGASLAALAIAGVIRLAYGSADRVVTLIGSVRARVLGRLSAFLLLCVGTQITVSGVSDVLGPLIASHRV